MSDMNSDRKPPQHQQQPIYGTNSNTPLLGIRKRQQPILTCSAHVFQIDPITKKSWIPSSTIALPVSFFYDASCGAYRIICTDGNKAFVNSTVLPGMNFTKTSQKFGQWSDKQTNIVYGLGFSTENELEKFDEQFLVARDSLLRHNGAPPNSGNECHESPAKHNVGFHVNGTSSSDQQGINEQGSENNNYATINNSTGATTMDMNANAVYQYNNVNNNKVNSNNANNLNSAGILKNNAVSNSYLSSPAKVLRMNQPHIINGMPNNNSTSIQNIYNSPKHAIYTPVTKLINESLGDSPGKMSPETMQLKYENERLRQALQQSSANAKVWEYELSSLKVNNSKLTTALQECNINVEDWKHQLQKYKEENQTLRLKILDIEAEVGKSGSVQATMGESELGKQLDTLRGKVNYYTKLLNEKDEQINCLRLKSSLANYKITGTNGNISNGLKMNIFGDENGKGHSPNEDGDILWTSIQTVHSQLQTTVETQDFQKKILEALSVQLSTKLSDLTKIQDKMKEALESSLR